MTVLRSGLGWHRTVFSSALMILVLWALAPMVTWGDYEDDELISRHFQDHAAIMLLIDPDDGAIVDANRRAQSFYGLSLDELRSLSIQDINVYPPERVAELREQAASFDRNFFVFPHRTQNHGVRSVAVYSSPVSLLSGREVLLSIIHDVTDHQLEESQSRVYREELEALVDRSLQEVVAERERRILLDTWLIGFLLLAIVVLVVAYFSRQRGIRQLKDKTFEAHKLEIAVDQSPASIVITDRHGTIEYVNQTCVDNSGYSREELIGSNPRMLQSGQTSKEVYASLWGTVTAGKSWEGRLVNKRKNGSEYVEWVLINPVLDEHRRPVRFIAVKEDVTEREQLTDRLRSLERFDALTGLANRFAFFSELDDRLPNVRKGLGRQTVALINIDRFHAFNEAHGHEAGDRLLQKVARRLSEHLPDDTLIARLGPDEFALLPSLDASVGQNTASSLETRQLQRIHRLFNEAFVVGSRPHMIRASIGVAVCDRIVGDPDQFRAGDFMRMADSAMHVAKSKGGGQLAFFDEDLSAEVQRAIQLEHDFARAIERNELRLALQAQVDANADVCGAEVLLRWRHASLGDISPAKFIPIAEETGLIVPVGRWVLEQSMKLLSEIQRARPELTLSVNISPLQIRHPGFLSDIQALIAETGISPAGLLLEITESVFLSEPELAQSRLEALRKIGVGIAIDDFGTGYSSLSYLKRLPVTELKIDQSFIAGLPDDPADVALVNIIVAAARLLGLRIVAEGVETQDQAGFFADDPDVSFQGYWFDRPKDAADWLEQWIT
ncbi:MAG: EAL domain-containing protein [Wenzhouxiangella sp.]|jgi:diguanylate cyclase (GGDEF)-like protein/PAS domain S-box-containing protein|nr:EAL domain-containing protein [Wenzhouxiangella sp.]